MRSSFARLTGAVLATSAALTWAAAAQAQNLTASASLSDITFSFSNSSTGYVDTSSVVTQLYASSGQTVIPKTGVFDNVLYSEQLPGFSDAQRQASSGGGSFITSSTANSLSASIIQPLTSNTPAGQEPFTASASFKGTVVMPVGTDTATITAHYDSFVQKAPDNGVTRQVLSTTAYIEILDSNYNSIGIDSGGSIADTVSPSDDSGKHLSGSLSQTSGSFSSGLSGANTFNFLIEVELSSILINPVQAVPEPATWAMFLAGLGVTGAMARRRQRTAS